MVTQEAMACMQVRPLDDSNNGYTQKAERNEDHTGICKCAKRTDMPQPSKQASCQHAQFQLLHLNSSMTGCHSQFAPCTRMLTLTGLGKRMYVTGAVALAAADTPDDLISPSPAP